MFNVNDAALKLFNEQMGNEIINTLNYRIPKK